MKIKINLRFLVILLASFFALALVVLGVHRLQMYRSATVLLKMARQEVEEGELVKASQHLYRYNRMVPNSFETIVEHADVLKALKLYQVAFFQYETALRLKGDDAPTRQKLVEVALEFGRASDAKAHLTDSLLKNDPQNPELLWLSARADRELGENAAALKSLKEAVALSPTEARYARDLAMLLSQDSSQITEAKRVLDRLVELAPENSDAFATRGRWLLGQCKSSAPELTPQDAEKVAAAWDDATTAVKLQADSVENAVLLADVALARQRPAEATPVIEQLLVANPNVPELYNSAAQLLTSENKQAEALAKVKDGLRAIPGDPVLTWNLVLLEMALGNSEAVPELLAQLRDIKYPEAPLQFIDAQLFASQGKWREAATLLEKARPQFDRSQDILRQVDFLLANCYQRIGNTDQQLIVLRRIISVHPNWRPARQALAEALSQTGRNQEAQEVYWQIVGQENPPLDAVLGLARILLLEGLAQGNQANWSDLERVIAVLEKNENTLVDVSIVKAELEVVKGSFDSAETLLKQALAVKPDSQRLHQALIALYTRAKSWAQAEEAVDAFVKQVGDSAVSRLERATVAYFQSPSQPPLELLDQLASAPADWSDDEKLQLASGFASMFSALELFDRAERQAQFVAQSKLGSSSVQIHQLLFELALRSRNDTKIQSAIDRVGEIEGRGALWRVGLATRLILQADSAATPSDSAKEDLYQQALNHLTEAAVSRPAWSRIPRLQGEIFDRQGKVDSAIDSYINAFSMGDKEARMMARTMYLLFKQNRFVEADKIVRAFKEQRLPFSTDMTRMASEVSLQLENFDQALELARTSATQSGKAEDYAWLGQIYILADKPTEAEAAFREAIKIAPSASAGWVALTQMYARQPNIDAARSLIKEALEKLADDGLAIAARCCEIIRDLPQAEANYRQALAKKPNDWPTMRRTAEFFVNTRRPELALPWLDQLVQKNPSIEVADSTWARRTLALHYGSSAEEATFGKAKALIEENLRLSNGAAEDVRAQAAILGSRTDPRDVAQAIALYEQLISQSDGFVLADNYRLAQLYSRTNDWPKFTRTMRNVMGNGGAKVEEYVRFYARALVDHGEADEAALWSSRLRALAPSSAGTLAIEASLLFQSNDYDRLMTLLKTASDSDDKKKWARDAAETFARSLSLSKSKSNEAAAFWAFAEERYAADVEQSPETKYLLASFLCRKGDVQRAIELASTLELSPDHLSDITLSALQLSTLSDEDAKKLLAFAEGIAKAHPEATKLQLSMGDLAGWVGDWQAAARWYRQVLKNEPNNFAALNNMASVLALTKQEMKEAESAIALAIQKYGEFEGLIDTRGLVRLCSGDARTAEQDFRLSIEKQANPVKDFHLAQALAAQGRTLEAKDAFTKAKQSGLSSQSLHPLERPAFEELAR